MAVRCPYFTQYHSHVKPSDVDTATLNLTFVDPCIIEQFVKKDPTKCNNVSKLLISPCD